MIIPSGFFSASSFQTDEGLLQKEELDSNVCGMVGAFIAPHWQGRVHHALGLPVGSLSLHQLAGDLFFMGGLGFKL
jgi:hypothetical protein